METLTIQKIENDNFLFKYYIKRALFWNHTNEFEINDFNDTTTTYGLYSDDKFVGLSLVNFDSNGNITSFKNIVDNLGNKDERVEYHTQLTQYVSNINSKHSEQTNNYVKKMKRF